MSATGCRASGSFRGRSRAASTSTGDGSGDRGLAGLPVADRCPPRRGGQFRALPQVGRRSLRRRARPPPRRARRPGSSFSPRRRSETRALLGLAAADDEDHRHLGQAVLADLVVDLLVAQVRLGAEARGLAARPPPPRRSRRRPRRSVATTTCTRRQPQRERAGVVLDQHADEALEASRRSRGAASPAGACEPSSPTYSASSRSGST